MTVYIVTMAAALAAACLWQQCEFGTLCGNPSVTLHNRTISFSAKRLYILAALFALALVPSLIVGTGGDYWNYVGMFHKVANGTPIMIREPGFLAFSKVIQLFTGNAQVLFFVFNFLSYALFLYCLKAYSTDYFVSTLCLFFTGLYFTGIPQMRQLLAIMLLFYSYRFILQKKLLLFVLTVIAATMFHLTALLALPFYFLLRWRLRISHYILFGFALLMLGIVADSLLIWLAATFYPQYLQVDGMSFVLAKGMDILTLLQCAPLVLLLAFYYRRVGERDTKELVFTNATIWYVLLNLTAYWVPSLSRMIAFLNIASVISIPLLLQKEPNKKVRILLLLCITVFYGAFLYYRFVVLGNAHLLPYVHIGNWKDMLTVN